MCCSQGGRTGIVVKGRKRTRKVATNQSIVPYNAGLLLEFECHLNVEVCSTVKSVQYLYKYVYKGPDRAMVKLRKEKGPNVRIAVDEIKNYVDSRYISSPEAFWKLAEFFMQGRYPSVMPLDVHLYRKQFVRFERRGSQDETAAACERAKRTKLTAWFESNASEVKTPCRDKKTGALVVPAGPELFYHEYPRYYRWMDKTKTWKRRENGQWQIGRMHSAFPSQGERWFLRTLLNHVKGATCYGDLYRHEDKTYDTFKDACAARGLLKDDKEWRRALREASHIQTGSQLIRFFASILKENNPISPPKLWKRFRNDMIVDIWRQYRRDSHHQSNNIPQYLLPRLYNTAMFQICDILELYGKRPSDYKFKKPLKKDCVEVQCREMLLETSYDRNRCEQTFAENSLLMNEEQQEVYDEVISAVYPPNTSSTESNVFFLDAPGGTVCTECREMFFFRCDVSVLDRGSPLSARRCWLMCVVAATLLCRVPAPESRRRTLKAGGQLILASKSRSKSPTRRRVI